MKTIEKLIIFSVLVCLIFASVNADEEYYDPTNEVNEVLEALEIPNIPVDEEAKRFFKGELDTFKAKIMLHVPKKLNTQTNLVDFCLDNTRSSVNELNKFEIDFHKTCGDECMDQIIETYHSRLETLAAWNQGCTEHLLKWSDEE